MQYQLVIEKYFSKKYKKLVKSNSVLKYLAESVLIELSMNPKSPTLKSHKVNTPKFGQCYSSKINGDIRIIWRYGENNIIEIIELLDIGGHDEVY
jgi:mRNA-degrading endonuclease YafQ of YafQ-DinJ toxin-antitoxin module